MPDASHDSAGQRNARRDFPIRIVLMAAVIGAIARLVFGLGYWIDKPLTRDEHEYLSLARSLTAGQGFVYDPVLRDNAIEPFGRAPGYPAFVALVGGGREPVTSVPTVVQIAQSFVGAMGVFMVGVIAYRMAGADAAAAAALLASIYPPLTWIAAYAMSEAVFWPLGLFAAWLFDRAYAARRQFRPALASGLILGCAILVRPAAVLFVPLAALVLLPRRQVATLAGLALGVVLVVGPWTIRNYTHHGRLIFVAADGGVTFWTGNHPAAIGEGDMAANPAIKLDNHRLRGAYPNLNEEQMEPIYYREAFTWIRAHPIDWVALEFRKLFYLVIPVGPSYTLHSTRYHVLSVVSYLSVLALALVALARIRHRGPTLGLWILAASAVVVALVFFPQERFRIPILDPTLVILAGATLGSWLAPRNRA